MRIETDPKRYTCMYVHMYARIRRNTSSCMRTKVWAALLRAESITACSASRMLIYVRVSFFCKRCSTEARDCIARTSKHSMATSEMQSKLVSASATWLLLGIYIYIHIYIYIYIYIYGVNRSLEHLRQAGLQLSTNCILRDRYLRSDISGRTFRTIRVRVRIYIPQRA